MEKTVDANNDGTFGESEALMTVDGTAVYHYVVTNTSPAGAVDPLTLTSLVDDRGTTSIGDDTNLLTGFNAGTSSYGNYYKGGDTDGDFKVDFNESWIFEAKLSVPVDTKTPTNTNTVIAKAK